MGCGTSDAHFLVELGRSSVSLPFLVVRLPTQLSASFRIFPAPRSTTTTLSRFELYVHALSALSDKLFQPELTLATGRETDVGTSVTDFFDSISLSTGQNDLDDSALWHTREGWSGSGSWGGEFGERQGGRWFGDRRLTT